MHIRHHLHLHQLHLDRINNCYSLLFLFCFKIDLFRWEIRNAAIVCIFSSTVLWVRMRGRRSEPCAVRLLWRQGKASEGGMGGYAGAMHQHLLVRVLPTTRLYGSFSSLQVQQSSPYRLSTLLDTSVTPLRRNKQRNLSPSTFAFLIVS